VNSTSRFSTPCTLLARWNRSSSTSPSGASLSASAAAENHAGQPQRLDEPVGPRADQRVGGVEDVVIGVDARPHPLGEAEQTLARGHLGDEAGAEAVVGDAPALHGDGDGDAEGLVEGLVAVGRPAALGHGDEALAGAGDRPAALGDVALGRPEADPGTELVAGGEKQSGHAHGEAPPRE
jgi:hypothetical protein